MNNRQRVLSEMLAAREQAHTLLRSLMEAKAQSEKHLSELKQADALKAVTGRSALENAVASTQRMIETLDRTLREMKREAGDPEAAALD